MNINRIKARVAACSAGLLMMAAATPVRAGVPVIDVAGLVQAVMSVMQQLTEIQNQYQQIVQYQQQIENLSNARGLGDVLNNPMLQNYVPREAGNMVRNLETGGYASLTGAARGLREAQMLYNCGDMADAAARSRCQSDLAKPYQQKAFMQDALDAARNRVSQINSLMARAGATTDAKEIAEVQARIGAENALLSHEMSQIQMMQGIADADARIAESRAREAQREQASRTRPLSDFVRQ